VSATKPGHRVVPFLGSPRTSYITGETIALDRGRRALEPGIMPPAANRATIPTT
jgi:hypothetical protein